MSLEIFGHTIDKSNLKYHPKMYIIVELIHCLYDQPDCGCGGLCHIVTDDDNIDDESLKFVIDWCKAEENSERIDKELSSLICELMLQLNLDQRAVLFKLMSDGWTGSDHDYIDDTVWDAYIDYITGLEEKCGGELNLDY